MAQPPFFFINVPTSLMNAKIRGKTMYRKTGSAGPRIGAARRMQSQGTDMHISRSLRYAMISSYMD